MARNSWIRSLLKLSRYDFFSFPVLILRLRVFHYDEKWFLYDFCCDSSDLEVSPVELDKRIYFNFSKNNTHQSISTLRFLSERQSCQGCPALLIAIQNQWSFTIHRYFPPWWREAVWNALLFQTLLFQRGSLVSVHEKC